jgi:recombination DNA repair RAD52 pathway protein
VSRLLPEQYDALRAGLLTARVLSLRGQSYLEQWDIRRHLIRIFGFGGYDFIRLHCELVAHVEHDRRHTVIYRYEGRLIVKDPDGNPIASYDDAAVGDAINQPNLGEAHDLALKAAASGALKRCAVNLGDQFGLGLYSDQEVNKQDKRMRSLVQLSLIHPPAPPRDPPRTETENDGTEPGDN